MENSGRTPLFVSDKTKEGLVKKFLLIQSQEGAKLRVLTIYFDGTEHVLWYYSARGSYSLAF